MSYEESRAAQRAELDALEALQRERRLTDAESDRLANLVYRQQQREYRLQARIRATRRKLNQLEAMAA